MPKMTVRRPRAGLVALACASAPLLGVLAGCGGGGDNGIIPDNAGTSSTVRMNCTSQCIESDTLTPGQMEAHFYIVDDGSRAQAQAGFFSGFSLGYNVELEGDVLNFAQGSSSTRMALPKGDNSQFFDTLRLPGNPYLADFSNLPTGEVTGQFQMVRATQTLTSTVTLPSPFRITAPGNNATSSKSSDAVTIQLDSVQPNATWEVRSASCVDTTGATWSTSTGGTAQFFSTTDSRSFLFDAAGYFDSLVLTRSDGTVAVLSSCAATVQATVTNNGTVADGFKAGSAISGIQLRTVTLNLR